MKTLKSNSLLPLIEASFDPGCAKARLDCGYGSSCLFISMSLNPVSDVEDVSLNEYSKKI